MSTDTITQPSTTATSYGTDEFHPSDTGHANDGGTAVVFGNQMIYVVPHGDDKLYISQLDLSQLQGANGYPESVKSSDNWTTTKLSDLISVSDNAKFKSKYRPQALVIEDYYYIFWMDENNDRVLSVRLDRMGNWSNAPVEIQNTDGKVMNGLGTTLAAMNYGKQVLLSWLDRDDKELKGFVLNSLVFDDAKRRWIGTPVKKLDLSNTGITKKYDDLSTNWFTQGVTAGDTPSDEGNETYNYFVAVFYSSDDHKTITICADLDQVLDPQVSAQASMKQFETLSKVSKNINVVRDPAGRLALFQGTDNVSGQKDDSLQYFLLNTDQDFTSSNLSWGKGVVLGSDQNFHSHTTAKGIAGVFISGDSNPGTFFADGKDYPCTDVSLYLMLLYCRSDESNHAYHIQCQMGTYGTAKKVPGYNIFDPVNQEVSSVYAIMEAFPFPVENIGNTSVGQAVASHTYGVDTSNNSRSSQASSISWGIKGSIHTNKGVGPAVETEIHSGTGSYFEEEYTVKKGKEYRVDTVIIDDPENPGQKKVLKYGEVHAYPQYQLIEDAFIFLDLTAKAVNGTGSPLTSQLRINTNDDSVHVRSSQFDTYLYTPGDINTYTIGAINAHMKSLYDALSDDAKAEFGEWGKEYANNNYFDGVIKKHVQTLSSDTINGVHFLDFSIDGNGGVDSKFQQIYSTYTENRSNLAASDYIGVGAGEEFSVFGIGESIQTQLLGGFESSMESSDGTGSTSAWGTNLSTNSQQGVAGANGYTANLAILRPSNLWSVEMKYFCSNYDQMAGANGRNFNFELSQSLKTFWYVEDIHPVQQPAK